MLGERFSKNLFKMRGYQRNVNADWIFDGIKELCLFLCV